MDPRDPRPTDDPLVQADLAPEVDSSVEAAAGGAERGAATSEGAPSGQGDPSPLHHPSSSDSDPLERGVSRATEGVGANAGDGGNADATSDGATSDGATSDAATSDAATGDAAAVDAAEPVVGSGFTGRHPVLVYTLLRLAILAAVAGVLWLLGARGLLLLVFAFLVSGLISMVALSRPREGAAYGITSTVRKVNARIDAATRAEDDDDIDELMGETAPDATPPDATPPDGPAPGRE